MFKPIYILLNEYSIFEMKIIAFELQLFALTRIVAAFPQRQLDRLHLLWYGRQHAFLETIEFIKTTPSTNLTQTNKDTTHGL